ncbi:uncharacterized protein LOC141640619 [Silene latifolia]|uniref:uncharacterized protein LOC141640619 n=1 Tax=Silene latifolia TaxID=37657 RepID=UPI003D77117E
MQPSREKSQANQDNWAANGEDSPVITIEYLRARLLAERSVSKAAKERADELSKRVKELEDQLKIVSLQRKRAEKATLDVLSYLESHGVSDISELYESESDQEDSLCESNTGKINEDKNFDSLRTNEHGKESSGSDHESAPSSIGSLSWKGRNKTAPLIEKKYFDSPTRRQTNSPLTNSSPRRRHGKSCRQIKRREVRLVVEEPSHSTLKTDVQDSNRLGSSVDQAYCLDTKSVKLEQSSDRLVERGFRRNEVSLSFEDQTQAGDASSSNRRHEPSGEMMERALKHQAQLIGLNEAQEKAQRDWEDKYADNHISVQDSCEPGNHSDVTEERDENKAGVAHLGEVTANHHDGQKEGSEGNFQRKQSSITHFNSFKLSPDADTGLTGNDNLSEMQSYRFTASDFAFPTVSNEPIQKHENGHHSIVPHEEPHRPDGILSALQEAKLILKQQISSLPKSNESAQDDDVYGLNIPLACSRLFRVPTDLPSQAPSHSRSLLPGSSRLFSDTNGYGRTYLQGYHSTSSPMDPRCSNSPYVTKLGDSARQALDFQSNPNLASSSKLGSLPYTSSPEFSLSPNRVLNSRLPMSEFGLPPSGSPLVYNHDFRPDMYR